MFLSRVVRAAAESDAAVMASTVRTYDYENFLCGVFLPKPVRESVYALRAFNVELARVRESVKNPEIGKMRFQFFRDQLDLIFKKQPVQSPLARALASAVYDHGLSRLFLERLITHREADLEARQPASLEDMEKYAEGTSSTLLYLSLKCAGIDDVEADHAASHIGKAQGLLTILRAAPFHAVNRRIYLPYNLCVQHKLSTEDVFRGNATDALHDVVFAVADQASAHVRHAREMRDSVVKEARRVLLPAMVVQYHLDRLQELEFSVFDPRWNERSGTRLQVQLAKASLLGQY